MANRLIHETSPYLRQHAHNPVDWFPWGEEAFAEAKRRNVPILLSVGYAACHWCHVMERESFADPDIAAQMNELFVNIKVDREERPDIDELYMRAVAAFNRGQGGWPMTVFLTPEGVPYFGGTYFPPHSRSGSPGMREVLKHVAETYHEEPGELSQMTAQVRKLLEDSSEIPPPARMLARDWLGPVVQGAADEYDAQFGGFGTAPKFPPHGTLAALIAHHVRTGDSRSIEMTLHTLDAMSEGGMYDLVGGGFCRYSVDREWRVPHFEKMLYDNAQLIPLYVDAWLISGQPRYARVVRETIGWLLREMSIEGGAFASSLDADSDGKEGSFYVFTQAELRALLEQDAARAAELLGVTAGGSFEHGASVLRLETPLELLSEQDRALLERALPKLLAARETRTRPARDDKQIVAWNALTISALARAAVALDQPQWLSRAVSTYDTLASVAKIDGRWHRIVKDGAARIPAFADDHANLLCAALDLWESTFDPRWLVEIAAQAEALVSLFWDDSTGLSLSGKDQPPLVARPRPQSGSAEPSANAMAALGLVRAGKLLMREDLTEVASKLLRSLQSMLGRSARSLGIEAIAGDWLVQGGAEIVIAGEPSAEDTRALLSVLRGRPTPFAVLALRSAEHHARLSALLPWTEGKTPTGSPPRATAYLCEGQTCKLPVDTKEALSEQIDVWYKSRDPSRTLGAYGVRVRAPELPADPSAWIGTDLPPTLASLAGHVVLLDFWTYCCVNCQHMLAELAAVEERYAGQPVVVIGVHCAKFPAEEIQENVLMAMRRHNVRHPTISDPAHALWEEYAVRAWPTLSILDTKGYIAHQQSGEISRVELFRIIDSLLAEAKREEKLAPSPRLPPLSLSRDPGATLRFPGKVHVWPDAFDQEMGREIFDGAGRVYISDTGHHRILECALTKGSDQWPVLRSIRSFGTGDPGFTDGPAREASFRSPQGVRRHGNLLYVADTENHALRQVDLTTAAVTTLAGTGQLGVSTLPNRTALANPRTLALRSPWDVEVMELRDHPLVFVAMAGSHQIWVYGRGHIGLHTGSGREDHIDGSAASAALAQPSALSLLGRYLLFADSETSSIRAVDLQTHHVVTVVGRGLFDFGDVDGPADRVRLQHPLGLTFAGDMVYVADTFNHKIKAIGLQSGTSKTLCGGLAEPGGIARAGDFLLVADTNHHRLVAIHIATGRLRELPLAL